MLFYIRTLRRRRFPEKRCDHAGHKSVKHLDCLAQPGPTRGFLDRFFADSELLLTNLDAIDHHSFPFFPSTPSCVEVEGPTLGPTFPPKQKKRHRKSRMLVTGLAIFGGISLLSFLVPFLVLAFVWKPQNLKDKYKCEWALVTGSSSGIGKVLTEKLCGQGLNVVMVALDDKLLDEAHKEVAARYPAVQVR